MLDLLRSDQKSVHVCGRSCFPPSILVQILLFSDLPPQSLYLQIGFTSDGGHEGQGWPGPSLQLTSPSLLPPAGTSLFVPPISVPPYPIAVFPSPTSPPPPSLSPPLSGRSPVSIATVAAVETGACLLIPWGGIFGTAERFLFYLWF